MSHVSGDIHTQYLSLFPSVGVLDKAVINQGCCDSAPQWLWSERSRVDALHVDHLPPEGATGAESYSTTLQLFYVHSSFQTWKQFHQVQTDITVRVRTSFQSSLISGVHVRPGCLERTGPLHSTKPKTKPFSNADLNTMAVTSMCT